MSQYPFGGACGHARRLWFCQRVWLETRRNNCGTDCLGADIGPVQIAKQAYYLLIWFLAVILLTAILVLDLAVYCLVIRPLKVVSETADRVSRGAKDIPILAVNGKDEIAVVTTSFNRMQLSLAKAFKMLDEQ